MMSHLERLLRYAAWANARTLAAVQTCAAAQAEAVPLLAHLLAAEHVWLARLEQRTPQRAVWPAITLAECAALPAENKAAYQAYWEQLTEAQLINQIAYRTSQGAELASSVEDILLQVITHGGYHRGQIAKIIGRHGGVATNTDFITFTREAAG